MKLDTIKTIKSFGFDVYMRNPGDTYCYYTDGTRIGYLQGEYDISTVHVPNQTTGTGFRMASYASLTKENLELGFVFAPSWANSYDRESVQKWRDIAHFLGSDSWHRQFQKQ